MFWIVVAVSGFFMMFELIRVNKYVSWYISIIPLFLLLSMIGFNRSNRDYENYSFYFYNNYNASLEEVGYAKLVDALKYFGLDHNAVVFIVGFLFLAVRKRFTGCCKYIKFRKKHSLFCQSS